VTQQLYRLFNADDKLLYVGISMSALNRIGQHKTEKVWWHEVAKITIETHHVERQQILDIERRTIVAEKPRYNIKHAGGSLPTEPVATSTGQGTPWTPLYAVGDVVAVGLRNTPTCFIGSITDVDWDASIGDGYLRLDLYSAFSGTFGFDDREVRIGAIGMAVKAGVISDARKKREGWVGSAPVFDMDPLGDFQTKWKQLHTA
jgi:hypothetical protein